MAKTRGQKRAEEKANNLNKFNPITTSAQSNTSQKDRSNSGSSGKDYSSGDDPSTGQHRPGRKSRKIKTESRKTPEIFIYHRFENGVINFFINSGQRPSTDVAGGIQGDHSTAYIEIIQAILSSTNSMGIESATRSFKTFGQSILKENHKNKFDSIKEPKVHADDFRKKVRESLESVQDPAKKMNQEDIDFISRQLKNNKINILAQYLCDLTKCFLEEIQQSQAAYYSKGRMDKDPNEGNIVKSAARALVALDKLCRLCNLENEEKFKEELKDFLSSLAPKKKSDNSTEEDHIVRYGLNILNRQKVISTGDDEADKKNNIKATIDAANETDEFRENLEKLTVNKQKDLLVETRGKFLSDSAKMAGFIGDLFDYKREITFELKKAATLSSNQQKLPADKKKSSREKAVKEYFDPTDHDINFDHDNNIVKITRTNNNDLVETLEKHLNITWAAFPHLAQQLNSQLVDCFFVNEVLGKQGWQEAEYFNETTNQSENLTVDYLKQELENKQNIQSQQTTANIQLS